MSVIIMTKRNNNFEENPSKKSKLDLDDLWGEEFNDDEIEACVLRATQDIQHDNLDCTQINNISVLPSYNAFKEVHNYMFTSTQTTFSPRPSTSTQTTKYNENLTNFRNDIRNFKRPRIDDNEDTQLQIRVNKLENELKAKSGENSILRSRINTLQLNIKADYDSKIKQANEKLMLTIKDLQSSKSELQFKDLEIANLKHKIVEVSSANLQDSSFIDNILSKTSHHCKAISKKLSTTEAEILKLKAIVIPEMPLRNKIDSSIFKTIFGNKFNRKLRNKYKNLYHDTSHNEILESYTFMKQNEKFSIDLVHSSMAFLMNCTIEQINDKTNYHHIRNILILLKLLLNNLHKFLKNIQENMSSEAIRMSDMKYLEKRIPALNVNTTLFDPAEWCKNEIGIQLRQILTFVSELLPYSKYLKQDILERKHIIFKDNDLHETSIYFEMDDVQSTCNLDVLSVILSCLNLIGAMRKTKNCVGFLCSTVHLWCNICTNIEYIHRTDFVNDTNIMSIKEIIRNRPNELVLNHLSTYMKHNALNPCFVGSLCNMTMTSLRKNSKHIIYFDSSSCVFQIFSILYKDSILNGVKNTLYIDTNLNMMKFFANIFNMDIEWLQFNENKCVCLTKMVELIITINYALIKYCAEEVVTDKRLADISTFTINLLSILNIKYNDLFENYLHTCSQFRAIIHTMQNFNSEYLKREDHNLLNQLFVYDEISDIRSRINEDSFQHMPSWIE